MSRYWQPLLQLVGRACLGLVFLSSAATRLRHFHGQITELDMAGAADSSLLLGCWIALAVVGGLMTALGWRTRSGLALLAFATVLGLFVDGKPDAGVYSVGLSSVSANLALLATIAALLAAGPGAWSFDASATPPPNALGDSNVLS